VLDHVNAAEAAEKSSGLVAEKRSFNGLKRHAVAAVGWRERCGDAAAGRIRSTDRFAGGLPPAARPQARHNVVMVRDMGVWTDVSLWGADMRKKNNCEYAVIALLPRHTSFDFYVQF
jgi:hypothetical protein